MGNPRLISTTAFVLATAWLVFTSLPAPAAPPHRFDVVTFCCDCPVENHLCEPQFDALNWPAANGHNLAMGSDAHRKQIVAQGNQLAIYMTFSITIAKE